MITHDAKPFDLKDYKQVHDDLKSCKPLVQKYVKWLEDRLMKANMLLSLHDHSDDI